MEKLRNEINEMMPGISKSFLGPIAYNPNVSHMLESLNNIESLVLEAIEYFFDDPQMDEETCITHMLTLGEGYCDAGAPIQLTLDFMDYIQHELLQVLLVERNQNVYRCISTIFTNLSRGISKGYLLRFAGEYVDYNLYLISTFRITKYYTSLIGWMSAITDALLNNDIKMMPDLNPHISELGLMMHQPQVKLILGEEPEGSDLMNRYYNIFNTANLLSYYFERQDFRQLYVLFQDLHEKADTFQRKLSESLALFRENVEFRFNQYVTNFIKESQHVSIIVINVNNLESINNIFSKDAGEKILDSIHMQVDRFVASTDFNTVYVNTVNDEFRIGIVDLPKNLSDRLIETLKQRISNLRIEHQGYSLPFYISFGSVYFDPESDYPELDLEKLYKSLVDRAKSNKRNESFLNNENIHAAIDQITNNDRKVVQLKNIFRDNRVKPHFQPIMDLKDNRIVFVEALARFDEEGTTYSLGSYIDLLVELDTIVELDIMILHGLLEHAAFFKKNSIEVFINVNPVSFRSEHYLDVVQAFLRRIRRFGVDPVFEITEQALLENMEAIEQLYARHKIQFALDDFGAGYSSLKMVVMLAERGLLKYLKIDGSLVREIVSSEKTYQVVDSIRYMANNLGVQTIAEYVENDLILEKSRVLGIDYAQGFNIAKPMQVEDLQDFLNSTDSSKF